MRASTMSAAHIALVLGLGGGPGCTWISQGTFEEKRNGLDQDLDGSPWSVDCDDQDPQRSPDLEEVPYDGIDNDCGGDGDLIDVDGDTYPGVAAADYPGEYPARFEGRPVDCVDDPALHPSAGEIFPGSGGEVPYDGIDSDCDGGNDFDADGDGYMPITAQVDGATVDVATAYPEFVATWGLEALEAGWAPAGATEPQLGDCRDFDPDVHFNPDTPDAWYDGEDTDCDGRNDFDADGDGFMPERLPGGGDTAAAYAVYIDTYYNNAPPWSLPADLILPDGSVLSAFSDCLDQEDPAILELSTGTPVDPAAVFPRDTTADDIWYDGIDANCWRDNDFDADGDGFYPSVVQGPGGSTTGGSTTGGSTTGGSTTGGTPPEPGGPIDVAAAFATYVAAWGYEDRLGDWVTANPSAGLLEPAGGDCRDDDPAAWPGALELLSGSGDRDCNGIDNVADFQFGSYLWDQPSPPRITRMGEHFVLAATATRFGDAQISNNVGQALFFDLTGGTIEPVFERTWKPDVPNHALQQTLDVFVDPTPEDRDGDGIVDPGMWFATTYTVVGVGSVYLYGSELRLDSPSGQVIAGAAVYNSVDGSYDVESLEIALDPDGEPYLLACGEDVLHAFRGLQTPPTDPELEDLTSNLGGVCVFEGEPYNVGLTQLAPLIRCGASGCQEYTLEGLGTLALLPGPVTADAWDAGDYHDGAQILRDAGGVVLRDLGSARDYDLFTGETVLSADAMLYDDQIFGVAVLDVGGVPTVRLVHGVHPALVELDLPYAHPGLPDAEPREVSLYVDADRVAVAVSGYDPSGTDDQDTVGWVFLGH